MSSAPIHRDSETKMQVAVRRGAPGAQIGARKVTARAAQPPAESADTGWVYDGNIRCTFGLTSPGSIAAGDSDFAAVTSVSFTGTPDGYVDTSTFLSTGLYILEGTINLAGTAGDVVKVSLFVGDNQFDRFVTMTGSTVEYTFSETGPAAVGESFIPWAVENLGANTITANPSGNGQLYPIILP